jgi:uncharacterized membrane protein
MATISRISADVTARKDESAVGFTLPANFEKNHKRIYFPRSGYVQNIDYGSLASIAHRHDMMIIVSFKAGYYMVAGEDGVRVSPARHLTADIEKAIVNAFIVGDVRTATQDIEYSVRHLVEIALRALSPGINDSYTAMTVLDRLTAALAHLFRKEMPENYYRDEDGAIRVIGYQNTEREIIFSALSKIRHAGQGMPHILDHMLRKIRVLLLLAEDDRQREALLAQKADIDEVIARDFDGTRDGERLKALSATIMPR